MVAPAEAREPHNAVCTYPGERHTLYVEPDRLARISRDNPGQCEGHPAPMVLPLEKEEYDPTRE